MGLRDWLRKERDSWAAAWDARMSTDDASAARLGGGWQPQSQPHTGATRPIPPSGGTSAQRPSQRNLACPIKQAGDSSWCERCGTRWDTNDAYPPECPKVERVQALPTLLDTKKALGAATLEDLFGEVLTRLDPDPSRQGIAETPARAAKAWRYWCSGYAEDVDAHFKSFEDGAEGYDEMVIVHNIPVLSHCEHHLAAITGHAHVGYIPNGRVVGLSKLARVVDALSRRLQVQERLTVQIADAIEKNLAPAGVAVIVKAGHGCMSSRGVRIHGSVTTTSALRGALHEGPARAEFLSLCAAAEAKASG